MDIMGVHVTEITRTANQWVRNKIRGYPANSECDGENDDTPLHLCNQNF